MLAEIVQGNCLKKQSLKAEKLQKIIFHLSPHFFLLYGYSMWFTTQDTFFCIKHLFKDAPKQVKENSGVISICRKNQI